MEHGQKGGYNMAYEGNYAEIPDWYPDEGQTMEPGNDELKEWQVGYKPPAQWRNWQDKMTFLALKAIDEALAAHEAKKSDTHNVGEGKYVAKTSNPNQYPRRQEIVDFNHGNEAHTEEFASKEWVLENAYSAIFDMLHPVGDVVIRYDDTNPGELSGWKGTWERIAENRMLIGQGSDPDFNTVGQTGGDKEVTLTEAEMPEHVHPFNATDKDGGYSNGIKDYDGEGSYKWSEASMDSAGGGQPHNNMPPYEVVYTWRRIA